MPSTLNESTPNEPPPPCGGAWPSVGIEPSASVSPPKPPLGSSPEKVEFVRLRAAVAAVTPSVEVTVSRTEASSVPRMRSVRSVDWLSVVVSPSVVPSPDPKSKRCPPASPGWAAAPVTVRSVPTP